MANQLATQRKTFLETINGDGFKSQLAMALPKHITPDRVLRVVLTSMNKNPKLYECSPQTVMAGIMQAAQLGLEIDGRNASLVPFKDQAQLIIGYQGFIELAYRHPKVLGVRAKVVYEKDKFVYDEGLNPKLEHTPYDGEDPGALKYAYAICNMEGGGAAFVVVNRREVMKAKKSARGSDKPDSPWNQHEASMWMKTAVRRLAPFMPKSVEMSDALSVDSESTIDVEAAVIPQGRVGSQTTEPSESAKPVAGKTITERAAEEKKAAEATPDPESEQPSNPPAAEPQTPASEPEPSAADNPAPKAETKPAAKAEASGPSANDIRKNLIARANPMGAGKVRVLQIAKELGIAPESAKWDDLDVATLVNIDDAWEDIAAKIKGA